MLIPAAFAPSIYRTLLPRPRVATVDWSAEHVPAPSIIKGRLRWDLFPYLREVLAVLDSRDYDIITLQFAARLGKTTAVQAWLLKEIATNPHTAIWAEPDAPSLKRVFSRTWKMIDGCGPCADKSCPPRLRSNTELRFQDCIVLGAYSGSPATAADEAAYIAILNELDKFSHRRRLDRDGNEAGEADFPQLVRDRTIGWPGAKIVQMSTPSIKGRSRIEAERLNGDCRRYFVPCPHCGTYQVLKTGRSFDEPGGIKFAKAKGGKLDIETAHRTAWYQCEHCRGKITDEERYDMINAGKWVKAGQSIDRSGRIRGTPLREGRHASFGPLGTHYSLLPSITWGMIAAEYVSELLNPLKRNLQNFINSIEGETFDPTPPATTPHELAGRLACETPRGQVPDGVRFLTFAADTGVTGTDLLFYWMVCGWCDDGRGHIIDWGAAVGADAVEERVGEWNRPGLPLIVGYDSGGGRDEHGDAVTERIYDLCRDRRGVWPVKGSSAWSKADWYSIGFQRSSATPRQLKRKKKAGLGDLLIMSTPITQSWREALCYGRLRRDQTGFVTLPAEVGATPELYVDFLDELTSDVQVDGRWQRRGPNEFGDSLRICRVLAELFTQGGKLWAIPARSTPAPVAPPKDASAKPQAPPTRSTPPQPPPAQTPAAQPFVRKMSDRSFQPRY